MNTSAADLFDELADEFVARYRSGERPTPQEYAKLHPDLSDEILDLFPTLVAMEVAAHDSQEGFTANSTPRTFGSTPPDQLGDFRIIREIGRGGMGVVYEAEQESLGRHVALKVLSGSAIASQTQQRRFQREARAAARMHHTNIVPVFGVGEADGHYFYIMQYIPGLALDDVLAEVRRHHRDGEPGPFIAQPGISASATVVRSMYTGRFCVPDLSVDSDDSGGERNDDTFVPGAEAEPALATAASTNAPGHIASSSVVSSPSINLPGSVTQSSSGSQSENRYWMSVARIGVQVTEALAYAHSQGIVHRDIKPANLLLDMAGTVWVTDFGLASLEDHQNLTRTGDIIGTLRYMPPESFRGQHDERGDIYSLGLSLYELLALQPAIQSTDRNQTLKLAVDAKHTPLNQIDPEIPRDLQTIVHKAIHREPDLRYQSAAEFSEDLNRYLRDEPILARRASISERMIRWTRRNPIVSGLTAVCATLLATTAVAFWYAWMTTSTALDELESQARQLATETLRAIDSERAEIEQKNRALRSEAAANKASIRARKLAHDESKARAQAEANLYVGQIALADREYEAGNIRTARELLDACPFHLRGWEWHYLNGLVARGLKVAAHITDLRDDCHLTISPDQTRVALTGSGADPGTNNNKVTAGKLRILDGVSLKVITRIDGLQRNRPKAAFFPDGKRIAVTGWTVRPSVPVYRIGQINSNSSRQLLSARTGLRTLRPVIGRSAIGHLLVTAVPDVLGLIGDLLRTQKILTGRISASTCFVAVHDADTGQELMRLPEFAGTTRAIAVHPDGNRVAVFARTYLDKEQRKHVGRLTIHELDSGRSTKIHEIADGGAFGRMDFSSDGRSLLIAGAMGVSGPVAIFDVESGKLRHTLNDAVSWNTEAVRFSPDGSDIAMVNQLGMIAIHDAKTGNRRLGIYCGESKLWDLDYSPDGQWIATAQDDHSLKVWNARTGELRHHFRHYARPRSLRFLNDGQQVISTSNGSHLQVWDMRIGPLPRSFTPEQRGRFIGFAHDGQKLLVKNGWKLFSCEASDPDQLTLLPATSADGFYSRSAISADGRRCVRELADQSVEVQDLVSGNVLLTIPRTETQNRVLHLAIDATGQRVAIQRFAVSGSSPCRIEIVEVNSQKTVTCESSTNTKLAFGTQGNKLLIGNRQGRVQVIDTNTGKLLRSLNLDGEIHAMAVSPDGRYAAIADHHHEIGIYELSGGQRLRELVGHTGSITFLAWHPDGKRIASASMDCDVRLWDPPTGRCMIKLRGHRHTIRDAMVFSQDGSKLLTQDVIERVCIWDATIDPAVRLSDLKKQAQHYFDQSDYETATDFYSQTIAMEPDNTALLIDRGRAWVMLRNWQAARSDYDRAVELGRDDVWTKFRPVYLALMTGDLEAYKIKRDQLVARNHTTDRADIAQETFRLCLLLQDEKFLKDPRVLALKAKAASRPDLPVWYRISQARYAYRIGEFDAWLNSLPPNSAFHSNAMSRMIVAMAQARDHRSSRTIAALEAAIADAESAFEDSIDAGTYKRTWHGIASTLVWLDEARGLLDHRKPSKNSSSSPIQARSASE